LIFNSFSLECYPSKRAAFLVKQKSRRNRNHGITTGNYKAVIHTLYAVFTGSGTLISRRRSTCHVFF
ncbi:unnamed protein product, partial [Allacma fusca]